MHTSLNPNFCGHKKLILLSHKYVKLYLIDVLVKVLHRVVTQPLLRGEASFGSTVILTRQGLARMGRFDYQTDSP